MHLFFSLRYLPPASAGESQSWHSNSSWLRYENFRVSVLQLLLLIVSLSQLIDKCAVKELNLPLITTRITHQSQTDLLAFSHFSYDSLPLFCLFGLRFAALVVSSSFVSVLFFSSLLLSSPLVVHFLVTCFSSISFYQQSFCSRVILARYSMYFCFFFCIIILVISSSY